MTDIERAKDAERLRMIGVISGLIQAIAAIRREIGIIGYSTPLPRTHVRKIAMREEVLAPLRALDARLTADMRSLQQITSLRSEEDV